MAHCLTIRLLSSRHCGLLQPLTMLVYTLILISDINSLASIMTERLSAESVLKGPARNACYPPTHTPLTSYAAQTKSTLLTETMNVFMTFEMVAYLTITECLVYVFNEGIPNEGGLYKKVKDCVGSSDCTSQYWVLSLGR